VGDASGIGGAYLAEIEGTIAGRNAAALMGKHIKVSPLRRGIEIQQLKRLRIYAEFLKAFFRLSSGLFEEITDAVFACRCEGVTAGEVRTGADFTGADLGACKQLTRAGMGICQGRICSFAVEHLVSQRSGVPVPEIVAATTRNPIKPISVALLVDSPLYQEGGFFDQESKIKYIESE
jgi:hypothetical protein